MSSVPASLGQLARALTTLLRLPTKAIIIGATLTTAVALLLTILRVTSGVAGLGSWILLVVAVILAAGVALFAWRRRRWIRRVAPAQSPVVSNELLSPDDAARRLAEDMNDVPGGEDVRVLLEAMAQGRLPSGIGESQRSRAVRALASGRFGLLGFALARLDQTQRALVSAAGGEVNAPYLKDHLFVTAIAFLVTAVAIPFGALIAIIAAFLLLLS